MAAGADRGETVNLSAELPQRTFRSRGRYQICMELASGGMATVYAAALRGTAGVRRVVAVKKMHEHLAKQSEFVEMFFDEAQVIGRIQHPAVCALVDLGRSQDSYFMAMEYLVGESLSEVMGKLVDLPESRSDPRFPRIAARIVAHLCEGLHAAHEVCDAEGEPLNVVHRDVTPQNLFVLYDGSVRVTDFGIARFAQQLHQTTDGVARGKLGYMAPEQLTGGVIDRRADVWSMGVVLWELLAGRALFKRTHAGQTTLAVTSEKLSLPSAHRSGIPRALDRIVMRALQRDVNKRYPTARAFATELEAYLSKVGDTVGAGVVATWLDKLFPGGAEARASVRTMAYSMSTGCPIPSMPAQSIPAGGARVANAPPEVIRFPTPPALPRPAKATPPALRDAIKRFASLPKLKLAEPPAHHGEVADRGTWLLAAVLAVATAAVGAWAIQPLVGAGSTASLSLAFPPDAGSNEQTARPSPFVMPSPDLSDARPAAGATSAPTPAAARPRAKAPPAPPAPRTPAPRTSAPAQPRPIAAPTVPASTASATTGRVYVTASGGRADVFLGNRRLGRTPVMVRLPPGEHKLRLEPLDGAPEVSVPVSVRAGADVLASVTL